MTDLTKELTTEELLRWTQGELELSRSANAFICEMASKYAKREKRLHEILEITHKRCKALGWSEPELRLIEEALSSEYTETK